jgi:hypothetical protein
MWIVQEVLLADELVLYQGNCSFAWSMFIKMLPHFGSKLNAIVELRDHPAATFAELVQKFSNQSCSDPRDRVYALNSLAIVAGCPTVKVDYNSSVEQVFCDAVCVLIREQYKKLEKRERTFLEREGAAIPGEQEEWSDWSQTSHRINGVRPVRPRSCITRWDKTTLAEILVNLRAHMMPEKSVQQPLSSFTFSQMICDCEKVAARRSKIAMPDAAEVSTILSGKLMTWIHRKY